MVRLLARLKDGTQEFVRDEDDLINLIEDRLGKDISDVYKRQLLKIQKVNCVNCRMNWNLSKMTICTS